MSCYDWERGTIAIPRSEYSKFKKAFMTQMKERYLNAYDLACSLQTRILEEAKGKRNIDWLSLFRQKRFKSTPCSSFWGEGSTDTDLDPFEIAKDSMFRKKTADERGNEMTENCRPLKPTKGSFNFKISQKNPSFVCDDGYIQFNDKDHSVNWEVNENNHAVESARSHPTAKILFGLLNNVKWTRSTGGVIVGNNEFAGDSGYEGEGANYITQHFGPIGVARSMNQAMRLY